MIVRDSAPLVSQIVGRHGTEILAEIFSNRLNFVYPRQTYFCPYKDTHLLESVFFSRAQSVYQNALVLISFVTTLEWPLIFHETCMLNTYWMITFYILYISQL